LHAASARAGERDGLPASGALLIIGTAVVIGRRS
jgi:hypothetical protein